MSTSVDSTFIGITDDRLLHVRSVGERAAYLSKTLFAWPEAKCREMFVLGFVHDIGYHYAEQQVDHEEIGGALLQGLQFKYWKEVFHHGDANSAYQSDELFILNLADMQTNKCGELVTLTERLEDIAERYGKDSPQYTAAHKVIAGLRLRLEALGADPAQF